MNAMTLLNTPVMQSAQFCNQHQTPMIIMGGREICPDCAKALVNRTNSEHDKKVQQMVREKHFAGAMLPARHTESGFRNYCTTLSGQQVALKDTSSFAKSMLKGEVRNLVMVGSTGTGKTHLACATARTLLNKGLYARYITSEDLAQDIISSWSRPDDNEKSTIYRYTEYDLLILDEYGLHDRDKRTEPVHKVLYARYDAGKPTMLISNFDLPKLKVDLGDRLWSRFQQGGLTVVECNWADARVGGVRCESD